jgi:hypothetical protein
VGDLQPGARNRDVPYRDHVMESMGPGGTPGTPGTWGPGWTPGTPGHEGSI